MNKFIIPSALVLLIASISVVFRAFRMDSVKLMSYGWIMAMLAALAFVAILATYIYNGLHNLANMEKIQIEEEQMKQRFKVESLYKDNTHTDEFLRGFAAATDFFAENFLTAETVGPTERAWYHLAQETIGEAPEDESYRAYMIFSLMIDNQITAEEYQKIGTACRREPVKELLGQVLYNDLLNENIRRETDDHLKILAGHEKEA